jgi:site-specific DNA-cytosine methylase
MQTVGALDTQCGLANQAHQSLNAGHYVLEREVMGTLTTRTCTALGARDIEEGALLPAIGFTAYQSDMAVMEEQCPTMIKSTSHAVAFAQNSRDELREMPYSGALAASPGTKQTSYVREGLSVRRLTPTECERLQGFPDGFTQIPWRNKEPENCPDGPRYKALGNSMAVPVMRWIGERIQAVEALDDRDL